MANKSKVLIVDDDVAICENIAAILNRDGCIASTVFNTQRALNRLSEDTFDLVITDLVMDGLGGIELLKRIRAISPDLVVIIITAYGSIQTAIEAVKNGAFDYITKPCDNEELLFRVKKGLEYRQDKTQINQLINEVQEKYSFSNILSKNKRMQEVFRLIKQVSETDVNILIRGETGTGKELVARSLHYNSLRKDHPFIIINCAALSETLLESELFGHEKGAFTGAFKQKPGKFELADRGTIFLDEIGDVPLSTQVKLLRVLEEREFERVGGTETLKLDIHLITATNKNLEELIKQGNFREDLYYRINTVTVEIPPLRDRLDDLPLLVAHFITSCNVQFKKHIEGISDDAMESLYQYSWPGNIRELENVIERAVLIEKGAIISKESIRLSYQEPGLLPTGTPILYEDYEKEIINPLIKKYFLRLLNIYNGNITRISQDTKINRKTLYRRLRQYGIVLR